jgi:hypothetical protein
MSDEDPKETAEAGEFTRLFGGGKGPASPDETVIQPLPVTKSEPPPVVGRPPQPQRPPQRPLDKPFIDPKAGPGEFTRMFKAPSAPVTTPPPAGNVAAPQESEFTRFFKANQLPGGREVNWKEVENRPEPAPEPKAPGEFTHLFGRSSQASPPSPTPAAPSVPFAPAPPVAERFASSVVQVDEFARIIGSRPPSSQAPTPTPANDSEAITDHKGRSLTILLVVIAAILILAGSAIYIFVIRK